MRKVTFKKEYVDNNIEISVHHLKQFFKFGHGANSLTTKAVHDVSFDIKKGECFGVVGESGCGKTTTGRSLIRLYNITSGSVYFEGHRISAGTRWNEKEIKWSRIKGKNKIKLLTSEMNTKLYYASINEADVNNLVKLEEKLTNAIKEEQELKVNYEQAMLALKEIEDFELRAQTKKETKENYAKAKADSKKKISSIKFAIEDSKKSIVPLEKTPDLREKSKEIRSSYLKQINEIKAHIKKTKHEQKKIIAQKKYDNKHVDKKLMSKMQMIFQDPVDSLDPRMTVEDIIQEGLKIQGQHNKFANSKKVADVLTKVGLIPEFASRYPHEFSGGQRQRIGIARALVMNPSFLICDEPISALDVSIRAQIINLLNDLKEEMGLTIMFIAHDLSVVKYFCDRIAVMYFGEMVELATSEELFKHPLHPYSKALLSAIPKPDPLTEKTRKRIVYDPKTAHDYSIEKPTLQEVCKGHFILANSEELKKYRKEIAEIDKKNKKE